MSVEDVTGTSFDINNNVSTFSANIHSDIDGSHLSAIIATHFFVFCFFYYSVAAFVQLLLFLLHMTFNRGKTQQATQKRIPGITREDLQKLEQEIRKLWTSDIGDLSVYKDVARLAKRITIFETTQSMLSANSNKAKNSNNNNSNNTLHNNNNSSSGAHTGGSNNKTEEQDQTKKWSWRTEISKARKIAISRINSSGSLNYDHNNVTSLTPVLTIDPNKSVVQTISDVVMYVANRLGGNDEAYMQNLKARVDMLVLSGDGGEMELKVRELFREGIGRESNTTRVFKVIHQQVIFASAYTMKVKVLEATGQLIKDIRTPDGWMVHIVFADDAVIVKHIRKEESVMNGGMLPIVTPAAATTVTTTPTQQQPQQNNFEIQWQLTVVFDAPLHDIRSVKLEVLDIHFREPGVVSEEQQRRIKQALQML